MGRGYTALLWLILIWGAFGLADKLHAQFTSDVPASTMGGVTAPIMDENNERYMGILYAKKGRIAGFQLQDVRFDFIKSDVNDPSKIRDISEMKIYPPGCDSRAVVDSFWKAVPHSQLILESEQVVFRMSDKNVSGEREVRLYSPESDLTGDGFSLDYTRRKLFIKSNVRVVIRGGQNSNDPASRFAFNLTPSLPAAADSQPLPNPLPSKGKRP